MDRSGLASCEYETERLRVGPWHEEADALGLDLATAVAAMLTRRTTASLPDSWRGDYDPGTAAQWITERDAESPTLLITELGSGRPVGLVVVAGVPVDHSGMEVRIGYLLAEDHWGRGLATELVDGLVAWARSRPSIRRLSGGVATSNRASARVLVKAGFDLIDSEEHGQADGAMATYQLDLGTSGDRHVRGSDDGPAARR